MDDLKPLPVLGYTQQSEEKVRVVNRNKVLEEQVLRQIEGIEDTLADEDNADPDFYRWTSIAKSHIQQGFMALNRAVFLPKRLEHID